MTTTNNPLPAALTQPLLGMMPDISSVLNTNTTQNEALPEISSYARMYHRVVAANETINKLIDENPRAARALSHVAEWGGKLAMAYVYAQAGIVGTAVRVPLLGPGALACGATAMVGVYGTQQATSAVVEKGIEIAVEHAGQQGRDTFETDQLRTGIQESAQKILIGLSCFGATKGMAKYKAGKVKGSKANIHENPADLYAAQAPYNPQNMREMLIQRHPGADISSSTLPLSNQKNVKLAGQRHPTTGIVFDQRGFPIFDAITKYDTKIAREFSAIKNRKTHMKAATRDLYEQIRTGKIDGNGFNSQQLQAIQQGSDQIPSFTWHHHQDIGRMQLIPELVHVETGHVGGMSIWFQE